MLKRKIEKLYISVTKNLFLYFSAELLYDNNMQKKIYESPMGAALSYLTSRMRTRAETEERLKKLGFGEEETEITLERLQELRLIDDSSYASEYLRSRSASGSFSRTALKYQLLKHKLEKSIIEEALEDITPEQEYTTCKQAAEKEWRLRSSLDKVERKKKVFAKLCRGGFDMDSILSICRELEEREEDSDL